MVFQKFFVRYLTLINIYMLRKFQQDCSLFVQEDVVEGDLF